MKLPFLCRIGLHAWHHQVVTMFSWRAYDHRVCERCLLREDHPSLPRSQSSPPELLGMPPYGAPERQGERERR